MPDNLMIQVKCESCGAEFSADEESAGQSDFCPNCGNLTDIPETAMLGDPAGQVEFQPRLLMMQARWGGRAMVFWVSMILIGGFVWAAVVIFSGDWESHHLQALTDQMNQGDAEMVGHDFAAADRSYQQLLDTVGDRKIKSTYLQSLIQRTRENQAQARVQIAAASSQPAAGGELPGNAARGSGELGPGNSSADKSSRAEMGSGASASAGSSSAGSGTKGAPAAPATMPNANSAEFLRLARITQFQKSVSVFAQNVRGQSIIFQDDQRQWRQRQIYVSNVDYEMRVENEPPRAVLRYSVNSRRTSPHDTEAAAGKDTDFAFSEHLREIRISAAFELRSGEWRIMDRQSDLAANGPNALNRGMVQPDDASLFDTMRVMEEKFLLGEGASK